MDLDDDELRATRKLNKIDEKITIEKDNKYIILPSTWKIKLYKQDENYNEIINCANCGREIEYGDSYKSNEIFSMKNKSYCICEKCHNKEWIRKNGELII